MYDQHEKEQWEYIPGLLQLMEEEVTLEDLATRAFVAPQVRGTGLATPETELDSAQNQRLARLWGWLRGFRRNATLCERAPIWVPIAQAWPAPGGSLEFSYTVSAAREVAAEIAVFALAGLGGASRRQLTSSVTLPAQEIGVGYYTRAFLTVQQYVNRQTGEELRRADVDCANEEGEFDSRDLPPEEHPLHGLKLDRQELRKRGYAVIQTERAAERRGDASVTLGTDNLRSWKFSVGTEVPALASTVKLGATCQRSRAFATKFMLPGGRDYAFCTPKGEAPVVPLCVVLKEGNESNA